MDYGNSNIPSIHHSDKNNQLDDCGPSIKRRRLRIIELGGGRWDSDKEEGSEMGYARREGKGKKKEQNSESCFLNTDLDEENNVQHARVQASKVLQHEGLEDLRDITHMTSVCDRLPHT